MLVELIITEYDGNSQYKAKIFGDDTCEPFLIGQGKSDSEAVKRLRRKVEDKIKFYQSIDWSKDPKITKKNLD